MAQDCGDLDVGVDGTARGWVAVGLRGGRFAHAWAAPTLAGLLTGAAAGQVIAVDIPLGLLDRGWRSADAAARARLGARRASVFAVAPRAAWLADDLGEANRRCRELAGGGLSAQAWGLRAKLLEADALREQAGYELREAHPELVFARLAGAPLAQPKRTWNGQMARRAALADAGILLPDDLPDAATVPPDDVLDAAAMAWCSCQMRLGLAEHLPSPADQHDHRGRPIVIWH